MELVEKCQRMVKALGKHIDDLKKQVAEARDAEEKVVEEGRKRKLSQDGHKPLKTVAELKPANKYGIVELYSPH